MARAPRENRLGLKILDYKGSETTLCAGCGQIGLEAHSRGARVVLNEPNRQRAAHLETICRQWELEDIDLRRTWAQDLIPDLQEQNQRFDIAYLDPPYRDLLEGQPLVLALLH